MSLTFSHESLKQHLGATQARGPSWEASLTQLEVAVGPVDAVVPVQVIIYNPGPPTVEETTGTVSPDGGISIDLPFVPPPAQTPIQVIIYDGPVPTIIEGVTTEPVNGDFGIVVPDTLVQ